MPAIFFHGGLRCHARFKVLFSWDHYKRGSLPEINLPAGGLFQGRTLQRSVYYSSFIKLTRPFFTGINFEEYTAKKSIEELF